MASLSEMFRVAVEKHRAGQWQDAQPLYLQIIEQDPRHAGALNLLGLIGWQTGRPAEALEYLRRAVEIDPLQAAIHGNLGEAYRGLGMIGEATASYEQAVRLQPNAAVAHYNLGTLYQLANQPDRALAAYQRTIQLSGEFAAAWHAMGTIRESQGQVDEARRCYQQAMAAQPQWDQGYLALGQLEKRLGNLPAAAAAFAAATAADPQNAVAQFQLANINQLERDLPAAIESYRQAIELKPDYTEAYCNLGNALREAGRLVEARAALDAALEQQPLLTPAISNLGVVLQDSGDLAGAQRLFEKAALLEPERAEFQFNLGTVLKDQGRPREAIEQYERALHVQPDYAQAVCSRGMALLSLGEFAAGWRDYERRVECPQFDTLRFPQPLWRGEPLGGRTLLIHCEQGLGDTLQFIRYLKQVRARAGEGTVVVAAQQILLPLLAQAGVAGLTAKELPLPAFDLQVPLLSLPHVFGTTLENVPAEVPYLTADAQRVAAWRARLADYEALRVGIAWQGRVNFRGDRFRSIPLAQFAPLASVPGVQLFSLQKGPGSEQLPAVAASLAVVDLASELDLSGGAFLDTAAAMQALDLVVTSDTAIAHLAGALGVPVWLALSYAPDWRWMLERDDTPWYPTMRLFRQHTLGDWPPVFARMAAELPAVPRRG